MYKSLNHLYLFIFICWSSLYALYRNVLPDMCITNIFSKLVLLSCCLNDLF